MKDHKKITTESYNSTVGEYIKNTDNLHQAKEGKKFISLLKKNSLILDLGCGPGRDAKIFAGRGFKVIGVDLSESMIKAAKERVKNAEFRVMDMLKLDFKDNYFDGIWASASFVHIPKRGIPKALKEARRVLKEKGIFYLSVKEGKGEVLEPDRRYGGVEKFWSFFKQEEIKEMLKKTGFDIIETYINKPDGLYATNPWINIFCQKFNQK